MKDATVSSDRLLNFYDRISDAEDAIPRLRRFVLDLAVRGKLMEQVAADEPAVALLKRIPKKKAKGGKQDNSSRSGSFPFTLPIGWSWTTLAEISTRLHYGYTASADATLKDVRLLRITDIQDSHVNWETVPGCAIDKKSLPNYLLEVGDILIARTGGTIGKTFLVSEVPLKAVFASYLIRVTPSRELLDQYIKMFCETGVYWDQLRDGSRGGGQPNVNGKTLGKVSIPLPPLAEQHRIVAKIYELMALCDQLEQARAGREAVRDRLTTASLARLTAPDTDAETFQSHARFALQSFPTLTTRPDQIKTLRQTILNLAVRGKLVAQHPTDEPASELLKRIANERIAGKAPRKSKRKDLQDAEEAADNETVPHGWVWARLRDVAIEMRYGTSVKCDYEIEGVPVLRIPNVSGGRISLDDMKLGSLSPKAVADLSLQAGDLLMIRSNGSLDIVGRAAVVTPEAFGMSFAGYLVRLRTDPSTIDPNYVWLAMNSSEVRDQIERPIRSAVGLKNVNLTEFGALAFRLPPLGEQHRIAAKVDALMALCDQLDGSLTTTAATRSKLLEALLHEALDPAADELEATE